MRIRIVCYEDVNKWILGKFALRLEENLQKLGNDVDIEKSPDISADINHHIIYIGYGSSTTPNDTLMITHIDSTAKLKLLKDQLKFARMGICMSRETMINLSNLGLPRNKLCYVNPAHDGVIKPRPYIIGITCRVQKDGRKNEFMVGELAKKLNPEEYSFKIMGEYWTSYVTLLKKNGFTVDYYEHFDYETYINLIRSLDFYLYMGMDEGQMGFIDALAAGVKTIVTPQGYHLDADGGISYPFKNIEQLLVIFENIAEERRKLINSVSSWNWLDYSKKHLDIWNYLLYKDETDEFFMKKRNYSDGIMSIEGFSKESESKSFVERLKIYIKLLSGRIRQSYYFRRNKSRGE